MPCISTSLKSNSHTILQMSYKGPSQSLYLLHLDDSKPRPDPTGKLYRRTVLKIYMPVNFCLMTGRHRARYRSISPLALFK